MNQNLTTLQQLSEKLNEKLIILAKETDKSKYTERMNEIEILKTLYESLVNAAGCHMITCILPSDDHINITSWKESTTNWLKDIEKTLTNL